MSSLLDDVSLHLVESIDDLYAFKRWVGERRETPLGIDTESTGLIPHRDTLRLVQFGDMHQGWALPWDLWKGGVLEIIKQYEGEWVCHNAPFEQRFFSVHGGVTLPWNRLHDTMVQASIDDSMQPKGLKPLSSRLVDATAAQGQKALDDGMKAQGWTWATVPMSFTPYWVYGALDPVLTAHLHNKLHGRVQAVASEAYSLEMATLRICTAMMLRGMRLDVPYVEKAIHSFQDFSTKARDWLKEVYGITSVMSSGQLSRTLIALGCTIDRYTDQGAPKMDKVTLEFFKQSALNPQARQLAQYVLAVRHAEKMLGSYLENFLDLRDANDIVRANINTMAARTGRMSVTDPALQTLPRDDTVIRGSFVPREGMSFLSCDLDQVEARIGAHVSEDEGLIRAFLNADSGGPDFFCGIASDIYQEDIAKGDNRRNMVKTIVYRSLYGGGEDVEAMSVTAGVPFDQMLNAKELFDESFPGIKSSLQSFANQAKRNNPPYIRSPLGRKFTMTRGREYTQGLNSYIQGHAAEYFKQRLVIIDSVGLGDNMILPVHDEILLEVPADEAEEALVTVRDCMSDRINYRVPLTADGKILPERWKK